MIFTLYLTKNIIILHEKPLFLTSHRAISNNSIMLNNLPLQPHYWVRNTNDCYQQKKAYNS